MAHVILNASDKLFNELHSSAHFLFESPSPTFSSMISIEHSTDQIIFENRTTENPGENDNAVIYDVPSVIVVLILLLIIAGTVIGNVLVCVAVCMVKKLRRPYNYLLVSLAFSDLCVAILVMPVALLNELWGGWAFGPLICDIWVSFDVLSCTASILNLCMISVDRYLAITKPLEYGVKRTPRRMCAYIAIVWIGAGFVSVPPVLILGNEHGMDGNRCDVCQNFYYQIYATFASFYLPLSVMVTVYYQIFRAARRIVTEERRARAHLKQIEETNQAQTTISATVVTSNVKETCVDSMAVLIEDTNSSVSSHRFSVVEVRNGGVNTKLAPTIPPLPPSAPASQDHDDETCSSEQNQEPQLQVSPAILELPLNREQTCPSPSSTITTCGSTWSLPHSCMRSPRLSRGPKRTSAVDSNTPETPVDGDSTLSLRSRSNSASVSTLVLDNSVLGQTAVDLQSCSRTAICRPGRSMVGNHRLTHDQQRSTSLKVTGASSSDAAGDVATNDNVSREKQQPCNRNDLLISRSLPLKSEKKLPCVVAEKLPASSDELRRYAASNDDDSLVFPRPHESEDLHAYHFGDSEQDTLITSEVGCAMSDTPLMSPPYSRLLEPRKSISCSDFRFRELCSDVWVPVTNIPSVITTSASEGACTSSDANVNNVTPPSSTCHSSQRTLRASEGILQRPINNLNSRREFVDRSSPSYPEMILVNEASTITRNNNSNEGNFVDRIHTIGVIDVGHPREYRAQSDSPLPYNFKKTRQSRMKFQLAKERKASTTLGIIMSAFIVCWLPFFVLALVRPFLRDPNAIPISVSSLFLWLGYANSTLNPIIYATLNKDFRRPFQEILCLRCSSLNNLMREDFYHSQFGPDTPTLSHVRGAAHHDRIDSLDDGPSHHQFT